MTNVVSMGRTCEYLVSRAARHRRAGRYDEAMVLLTKARTQFGASEDIEMETARVYDEIGCEEEAARSYLRVVRNGEHHKAEALFQLSLSCAQRADINRAVSYFQQFAVLNQDTVSKEMALMLGKQLHEEITRPAAKSARRRAQSLERKAAQQIQIGKTVAAKRAIQHAISLRPTAQNYTLLACCQLLRRENAEAVSSALTAHRLAPARVQSLCVLADAYMAAGEKQQAKRAVYLAALRAESTDDLLAVAVESAKYGEDHLTIRLSGRILGREPYHMRGMLLRAGALTNLGRLKEAARLFGRICGLMPENTVSEYFFRLTKEGIQPDERLMLTLDVTRKEGLRRCKELIAYLYQDSLEDETGRLREICRLCDWAIHSPMAGGHAKTVALILLSTMESQEAREVLLDTLTDPQIADGFKMSILQVLTAKEGFKPYAADIGGRLVRLAAGGVSDEPMRSGEAHSRIVQRASDGLVTRFQQAPKVMLALFLKYLKAYGQVEKRHESACCAALEYVYLVGVGCDADIKKAAERHGATARLAGVYARRLFKLRDAAVEQTQDSQKDEG